MFVTVRPLNPGGTEKYKNSAFGKFHYYNSEFSVCLRSSVEDGVTQLLKENGNMILMTKEVLFEGFHLVGPGSVTDSSLHWLIKRGERGSSPRYLTEPLIWKEDSRSLESFWNVPFCHQLYPVSVYPTPECFSWNFIQVLVGVSGLQSSGKFLERILPSAISTIYLSNSWVFFFNYHPTFGWPVFNSRVLLWIWPSHFLFLSSCLDFSFPICTACPNVHEWRGPWAQRADRGMGREMGERKNPRASCLAPGGISHVAATAELIIDLFELCLPV